MIHRLLYTALQAGLDQFAGDPGLIEELFGDLLVLQKSEVDAIKKVFRKGMPRIDHAYSPDAAKLPSYTIDIGAEQQNGFVLGNTAGLAPRNPVNPTPIFATMWRHQYTIWSYALQPDMVEYMYELSKCAIFLQLDFLQRQNCMEIQMGGQDLGLDERGPERLFSRGLTFSCVREFRFFNRDSNPRLFAIDGLYIRGGSASSGGDVNALIQTTLPNAPITSG